MLLSLHIGNIAVIRSVDIDFPQGFSALTGETGAGKSMIIDSVYLLLGAKADKNLIRTGSDFATVSGLFGEFTPGIAEKLGEVGVAPDEEGNILVQRTLTPDGKSQIRINGRAVSLALLRAVTPYLVSVHGQNDTQSLLNPEHHLELIDIYGGTLQKLAEYKTAYAAYCEAKRELETLAGQARERERLTEMLKYQIADIDALSLHDGEEEELVDKKVKLRSNERIMKQAGFVFKALKGSEKGSVSFLLDRSIAALTQIADVIAPAGEYAERLRDILYSVDDIAEEAYAITEDADGDPTEKLNAIESRLDKISKLKRKYGLTVADILAFRDRAAHDLDALEDADGRLEELAAVKESRYRAALALAEELHIMRAEAASRLEGEVKSVLDFLDMPKVVFFASVKQESVGGEKVLYPNGADRTEFFISANRGADPQPIAKIASGGELARIMLALKCALAEKDGVPTLIFDEIDAGVSGKTARKIGIKMRELANGAQVFCVTHSAQIASLSDTHFLISKTDVNGATETQVRVLDFEGRVSEISRILGGISVSEAQRRAAVDMLNAKDTATSEDV